MAKGIIKTNTQSELEKLPDNCAENYLKQKEEKVPNIEGNYNHEKEGLITEDFLEQVIEAVVQQCKKVEAKYVTVHGYYNLKKASSMTLQQILNFMYSKGYSFKFFISQDRNIMAEMLFERK